MSILNPVEREQYVVGGVSSAVSKLAKPLVKLFNDYSDAKAIKAEMVAVHKAVEKPRAGAGPTRKKIIETVAEDFDMTPSQVKNIEKVYAYRAGGGGGDENILGETAQTIRAMVTKPTSGQQISEELGGTKTTRAARRGKGFAALKTAGLLSPAVIGSNIYSYNLGSAEEKEEVEKEVKKESKGNTFESVSDIDVKDMDAAFSKAFTNPATYVYVKGNKSYFKYKGEPIEFKFATEDDVDLYPMPVREGKTSGSLAEPKPPKGHAPFEAETYRQLADVQSGKITLEDLSKEDRQQVEYLADALKSEENTRSKKTEGSLMVPPEMPIDTYTPEDQANAEETQLPDDEMEEDYIDFVLSEALQPEEQDYLMETLEADSRLSQIFDKVVETASEFSGAGEVEGPGTGVSDSIPARLSDGEFVMTRKATDQIGADNLQRMMDDAERAYDGGLQRKNEGGLLSPPIPEEEELEDNPEEEEINRLMMGANKMPSVR